MTASLKDEYTWVRSPEEVAGDSADTSDSFSGIGITTGNSATGVVIRSVFQRGAAEKAGLKPRDLITHIDGEFAGGLDDGEVIRRIRGNINTIVRLGVTRGGEDWVYEVVRQTIADPSITTQILPNGVGYLRMESFNQLSTVRQMRRALRKLLAASCSALVLDMRGNSGGYIEFALDCASMFLDNAALCFITDRVDGESRHQVTAHYCGRREDVTLVEGAPSAVDKWVRNSRRWRVPASLPVAVLVDAGTASAAELFTGALKDNSRAIVVGTRTFGKGIGQTTFEMPMGTDVVVTSLHYRTPAGIWPGDAQRLRPRLRPNITVRGSVRLWAGGFEQDKQLRVACRLLARESGKAK